MSALAVWKRLLWKEMREGWVVVFAMFVAPPVLAALADRPDAYSSRGVSTLVLTGSWLLLQTLVILWASGKANASRIGVDMADSRLPSGSCIMWVCSFLLPLSICAAAGALFALEAAAPLTRPSPSLLMALDTAVTFAVCYLICGVASCWAAIATGIGRVAIGGLFALGSFPSAPTSDAIGFVLATGIGCAAGTLVFAAMARRVAPQQRKAMALLTALLVVFISIAANFDPHEYFWWRDTKPSGGIMGWWLQEDRPSQEFTTSPKYQQSNYAVVPVTSRRDYLFGNDRLEYRKYPVDLTFPIEFVHTQNRLFRRQTAAVGANEDACYLVQQLPHSDRIQMIRWDLSSNTVRTLASVKLRRDAFNHFKIGPVSPDGRYIAMMSESRAGIGVDFWLLDLADGSATVVLDNTRFTTENMIWNKNHIVLTGDYPGGSRPVIIDLRTKRGTVLTKGGC